MKLWQISICASLPFSKKTMQLSNKLLDCKSKYKGIICYEPSKSERENTTGMSINMEKNKKE